MPKPHLVRATLDDYPTIQNMARFYVYDLSRECGHGSTDWALPEDGLYESFDLKNYFEDPTRKAYLICSRHPELVSGSHDNKMLKQVQHDDAYETAGFVLLNQVTLDPDATWNMGEFFILARFQRHHIGQDIAHQIFKTHPGIWEVSVIPENKTALLFWSKTISTFTDGQYSEKMKNVTFDAHQPRRVIFSFNV